MEDLFQIGSIGLLKAVDHFNPEFDVKFSTYAVPMIIGEIKRFLRDDGILKKTAVSEAVTNCIIHGYQGEVHKIRMKCVRKERTIYLDIEDDGIGIADVEKAMEPLYTTRADQDRSGMGFTFMEAFMDEVKVTSQVGKGTCVHMSKKIGN